MTEETKSEKNYYIENIKVDENTALKYWKKVNKPRRRQRRAASQIIKQSRLRNRKKLKI